MPNRPIHIATSTPAGVAYDLYKANNQHDSDRLLEAAGGIAHMALDFGTPRCLPLIS